VCIWALGGALTNFIGVLIVSMGDIELKVYLSAFLLVFGLIGFAMFLFVKETPTYLISI